MAECQCNITNGLLSPGVFNVKQFLNETQEMRWTVSSHLLPGGIDLANYDAFLVLQRGNSGEIDEVMLSKVVNDDGTITLMWNIGKWATWLKGYVKYQIVFRGSVVSDLNVSGAKNSDANGIYKIVAEWAGNTDREWVSENNGAYKINYDAENLRWQLVNGDTVESYQTVPHDEPHYGLWDNLYVGNVSAMAWRSLEAVMYISESIAADEQITAKYPTILRQMWAEIKSMVIKSGTAVEECAVWASDWQGSEAPYYVDVRSIAPNIPGTSAIVSVSGMETQGDGSQKVIDNITFVRNKNGTVQVFTVEKFTGKVFLTLKGGNGYSFIADDAIEITGAVASVNGKSGIVTLTAEDLQAVGRSEFEELRGLVGMAVERLEVL